MKRIIYTGKSKKKICPTCKEYGRVTITKTPDGWERWECEKNGCINEYQRAGRVN